MSTALPPDEKRQLAALRALLSSEDAANVEQGAHLLAALVGTSVFAIFAAGVGVTGSGELTFGEEVRTRVRSRFRPFVALSILATTPSVAEVEALLDLHLAAPFDFGPFNSLRSLEISVSHPGALTLNGLPALSKLQVKECNVLELKALPALVTAELSATHLRIAETPALTSLSLSQVVELDASVLPALTHASVKLCAEAVERTLAAQPAISNIELHGSSLDLWSGARSLAKLRGWWTGSGQGSFPALVRVEGSGPIPKGAPLLEKTTFRTTDTLYLDDLPSLKTVILWGERDQRYPHLREATLSNLPPGVRLKVNTNYHAFRIFETDLIDFRGFVGCQSALIDGVDSITQLTIQGYNPEITLRNLSHLGRAQLEGTAELENLPELTELTISKAPRFPTIRDTPKLTEVTCSGPLEDLEAVTRLANVRSLRIHRCTLSDEASRPLEIPLLPTELTALVGAMPTLTTLTVNGAVDVPALNALLQHPSLTSLDVAWDTPHWLRAAYGGAARANLDELRGAVRLLAAGLERYPPPPAHRPREALAAARKLLDANQTRPLLALFAEHGPDLARSLCEGTYVDATGQLVIGAVLTRATRVGVRGDAALLVADAAGLLTNIQVLSLRGIPLSDLGVLRRHAKSLRYLDLVDCSLAAQAQVLSGDALLRVLDATEPLDGDPTAHLIAPLEVDKLPALLGSSDAAEVAQGVELAAAQGRVAEVLEGCALASWDGLSQTGRFFSKTTQGSAATEAAVLDLLGRLASGSPVGQAVTAARTAVVIKPNQVPLWIRHAKNLTTLTLSLSDVTLTSATLSSPAQITKVTLTPGDGDLAALHALPRLAQLVLSGAHSSLRGLEGHPSLTHVIIDGSVEDPCALAQLPELKHITTKTALRVDGLLRAFGDRPITLVNDQQFRFEPTLTLGHVRGLRP